MRLRELRLERNMSQQRLAMELSMTQNTISRYENGEREPGIKELIRIADYFNVSLDYLLERSESGRARRCFSKLQQKGGHLPSFLLMITYLTVWIESIYKIV